MGLLRRLLRRSSVKREWNWDLMAALSHERSETAAADTAEATPSHDLRERLPRTKVMLGFTQGEEVHLPDDDARSLEMRRLADEIWVGRKVGSRAT